MIIAVVGSGGKTTFLKKLAAQYRSQGKKVLVTTTTHMLIEEDTLLTDDRDRIIRDLDEKGYAMVGIPEGQKIGPLSRETFEKVSVHADVTLVEADGSKRMPLKFPASHEPVIPENTDEIIVVCSLDAVGKPAWEVCHRLELVKTCLGIEADTLITPAHIRDLVTKGFLQPLKEKYPDVRLSVVARSGTRFIGYRTADDFFQEKRGSSCFLQNHPIY